MKTTFALFGKRAAPQPAPTSDPQPSPATAHIRRGDAANRARDWAAAAGAYADALRADPALAHIWVQYGHALKEQGALHGAEAAYRRALCLKPGDSDIHLQLGHALKLRGRPAEALAAYEAACACDEPHPEAGSERARLAATLPRTEPKGEDYRPANLGPAIISSVPGPAPLRAIPGPAPVALRLGCPAPALKTAPCRRTLLAADPEAVADAYAPCLDGREVLSLDVFDTLLLRGTRAEAARYADLSVRIAARIAAEPDLIDRVSAAPGADDLLLARIAGLRDSYRVRPRREGCGEGVIDEVFAFMARRFGGGAAFVAMLEEEEIAAEIDDLVVNPALRLLIERHRARGGRVIAISDMYLRARHIARILAQLDPALAGMVDAVHSSADWLFSKRSGRLFGAVAETMDLGPGAFVHLGDSFEGDVRMARRAGWAAAHFPVSQPELRARATSLRATVDEFAGRDLDISDWAKM